MSGMVKGDSTNAVRNCVLGRKLNHLMSTLPDVDELSSIVPIKHDGNNTIVTAVPEGESSYVWFVLHETEYLCMSFKIGDDGYAQMDDGYTHEHSRRACHEIPNCFDKSLAHHNGSIFIAHRQDAAHNRSVQLALSNVIMYKSVLFVHESWNRKWERIASFLEKNITNCPFRPDFAIFGVPNMWTESHFFNMHAGHCRRTLEAKMRASPYKIAGFGQMRGVDSNAFQFVPLDNMIRFLSVDEPEQITMDELWRGK